MRGFRSDSATEMEIKIETEMETERETHGTFAVIGGAALVQSAKHFRLPCQLLAAFVCDRCDFQSAKTIPRRGKSSMFSENRYIHIYTPPFECMPNRDADYRGPILSRQRDAADAFAEINLMRPNGFIVFVVPQLRCHLLLHLNTKSH